MPALAVPIQSCFLESSYSARTASLDGKRCPFLSWRFKKSNCRLPFFRSSNPPSDATQIFPDLSISKLLKNRVGKWCTPAESGWNTSKIFFSGSNLLNPLFSVGSHNFPSSSSTIPITSLLLIVAACPGLRLNRVKPRLSASSRFNPPPWVPIQILFFLSL